MLSNTSSVSWWWCSEWWWGADMVIPKGSKICLF
jgi:hypothetical protein